ncbi:BRO1 domain-containing protein [Suillus fuscotomentosus]|uniref:pH-response regulator protein palC n=1 Tax=Suillus fuscotomentosus TaxID=1912939 RepID=A0AAD4E6J8_9AGAM|nr:BRO1 domain-containing protein [Suillus fuscotomentosus]KAG1900515.1 BRO1 domain-containing protein [Suillus fuscotomentosus]
MSTYLYELPTTGAISFGDFCVDTTASNAYASHIAEATQARANLRGVLKVTKRTGTDDKDYLRLIKVLDDYLPYLHGIMACVVSGDIRLKSEPQFSWRTTLSAHLFHMSPRITLASLHADLASSLLTYAFALSNFARVTVESLGSYEYDRAISEIERKAKDEKLNFAVTMLCRASGIFTYVSEKVLLDWDKGEGASVRPPDLRKEVNAALAKMALADAQTLAIRKFLSKSAYDNAISPGPPLPKSHPSIPLIFKFHLECVSLYSSARALAMTLGSTRPSSSSSNPDSNAEVCVELRRYLADASAFHTALAHKWLGVDAGESGVREKGGEAVAWLLWAKKELEDMKESGLGIAVGRDREKRGRKGRVADELESVGVFLKHYKKINDSLTFQPVPKQQDLQARIPTGILAVHAKPYTLPSPAFGPGSVEHARLQTETLTLEHDDSSGDEALASTTSPRTYAGAGSYF